MVLSLDVAADDGAEKEERTSHERGAQNEDQGVA
jgi:hypothetical protein